MKKAEFISIINKLPFEKQSELIDLISNVMLDLNSIECIVLNNKENNELNLDRTEVETFSTFINNSKKTTLWVHFFDLRKLIKHIAKK